MPCWVLSQFLTCGGHSHFRKKSSLALARNSFTKEETKVQSKIPGAWMSHILQHTHTQEESLWF